MLSIVLSPEPHGSNEEEDVNKILHHQSIDFICNVQTRCTHHPMDWPCSKWVMACWAGCTRCFMLSRPMRDISSADMTAKKYSLEGLCSMAFFLPPSHTCACLRHARAGGRPARGLQVGDICPLGRCDLRVIGWIDQGIQFI